MLRKPLVTVLLILSFAFGVSQPASAQFAVIDVASIAQLVQQIQQLEQQVQTARSQLSQAQAEYASMTGGRGMEQLLGGTTRNYLPADWSQLSYVLSGSSGSYPALAGNYRSLLTANAVLTPVQVAQLSPLQQVQLNAARQSPALLQATSRAALANSSDRFTSLQQLISAIGGAADQKAALDLNARITAEQAMLQNEQTKLQGLYQVAQSQEWARAERAREQAIADQGSLRQLPAMGL
jgi:type IV secretion system protein VirB5